MSSPSTRGRCYFCRKTFAKSGMAKHLASCPERQQSQVRQNKQSQAETERILHLFVEGDDRPEYWQHVELPETMTLLKLDRWLREVWLECCGHMSAFHIGGQSYARQADKELGFRSMQRVWLGNLVGRGDRFGYDYDFGTMTTLRFKVVDEREGVFGKERVEPMAVNEPPDIRCQCGAPATQVCGLCLAGDESYAFCDTCAPDHECGEEMLLPVLNSPRMGVCGYGAV